jgi:hypothetical protein
LARSTTTSFGSPAQTTGIGARKCNSVQGFTERRGSVRFRESAPIRSPCAPGRACSIDQHFRKSHGQ